MGMCMVVPVLRVKRLMVRVLKSTAPTGIVTKVAKPQAGEESAQDHVFPEIVGGLLIQPGEFNGGEWSADPSLLTTGLERLYRGNRKIDYTPRPLTLGLLRIDGQGMG